MMDYDSLSPLMKQYARTMGTELQWTVEGSTLVRCFGLATEATVPQGITVIRDNAFSGCVLLETVIIPDSVVSLGKCPFLGCRKLKNIHIPGHLLEGMEALDAMELFSDVYWNHPSLRDGFLEGILEGTAHHSDAFRNLVLSCLTLPANAYRWLRRSIEEDRPQWVPTILAQARVCPRREELLSAAAALGRQSHLEILTAYEDTKP